jgi:hypothetical protein
MDHLSPVRLKKRGFPHDESNIGDVKPLICIGGPNVKESVSATIVISGAIILVFWVFGFRF